MAWGRGRGLANGGGVCGAIYKVAGPDLERFTPAFNPAAGYLAWVLALLGRRPGIRRCRHPSATLRSVRTLIRVIASTRPRFASSVSCPCRYRGWLGPRKTVSGRRAPWNRQTGIPNAQGFLQRSRLRLDRARHCGVWPARTLGNGITLQFRDRDYLAW